MHRFYLWPCNAIFIAGPAFTGETGEPRHIGELLMQFARVRHGIVIYVFFPQQGV